MILVCHVAHFWTHLKMCVAVKWKVWFNSSDSEVSHGATVTTVTVSQGNNKRLWAQTGDTSRYFLTVLQPYGHLLVINSLSGEGSFSLKTETSFHTSTTRPLVSSLPQEELPSSGGLLRASATSWGLGPHTGLPTGSPHFSLPSCKLFTWEGRSEGETQEEGPYVSPSSLKADS